MGAAPSNCKEDLSAGRIYPALSRIRPVSVAIATGVAEVAYDRVLAGHRRSCDVFEEIRSMVFEPDYIDCACLVCRPG